MIETTFTGGRFVDFGFFNFYQQFSSSGSIGECPHCRTSHPPVKQGDHYYHGKIPFFLLFLLANTWIVSGSTRPFVSGRSKVRRLKNEMSRENNIFASKLHLIPLLKCEVLVAPAKNGGDPKDKGRYQWVEGTLQVAKLVIIICETF